MIIRKANINDAEAIAENNVKLAYESEGLKISYETTLEGVKSVLSDPTKGFYLVAEKDNEIIGELMITFEWSDWRSKNIWWIQSVYVKESWRRKNVFKILVEKTKKIAIENDVSIIKLYVHSENKKAITAYNRVGMKKTPYEVYELFLK